MTRYIVEDLDGKVIAVSTKKKELVELLHTNNETFNRMLKTHKPKDEYVIKTDDEGLPDYVWCVVTDDKYEYPIGTFDTVTELAKVLNIPYTNILSNIRHQADRGYNCKYKKIYIGEGVE